jgi:hypothetical protein
MLLATLKWWKSAGCTGPDEFGPLSGDRWHIVLRRFPDVATNSDGNRAAADLEYLVKLLERDETKRHGTERRWADILGRSIRDDYEVTLHLARRLVRGAVKR